MTGQREGNFVAKLTKFCFM